MSESHEPTTPEELRADIEAARTELADTVDALTAKLDVKGRASDKASQMTTQAKEKVGQAVVQAKEAAPPQVQHAMETVGEKAAPALQQISARAEPHRSKLIAAGVVTLVVLLVARRRSHSDD